jgi:hypothetical protein
MPSSIKPDQIGLLAQSESRRKFLDLAGRHRTLGLVLSKLRTTLEQPTFGEVARNE